MLIITGYPMPGAGKILAQRPGVNWVHKPVDLVRLHNLVLDLTRDQKNDAPPDSAPRS
jgi:hypothetical protein